MKIITIALITAGVLLAFSLPTIAENPDEVIEEIDTGNCLSSPVIWGDGETLPLRGEYDSPVFSGEWWYWWGPAQSCLPDPDDTTLCDDGIEGTATGDAPVEPWEIVYPQQDAGNAWQAESADATETGPLDVSLVDWGDNLESKNWNTISVVRTEVVLWQDLYGPMKGFIMRHLYGSGTTEMWGTNTEVYNSNQATVYSPARLTIQELEVDARGKSNEELGLTWNPETREWEGDIAGEVFEDTVYTAEINVGGKVVYGYNWNIRRTVKDDGYYRLTFILDAENTFFTHGITQLNPPPGDKGGIPGIDYDNNLAYMDVEVVKGHSNPKGPPDGGGPSDNT